MGGAVVTGEVAADAVAMRLLSLSNSTGSGGQVKKGWVGYTRQLLLGDEWRMLCFSDWRVGELVALKRAPTFTAGTVKALPYRFFGGTLCRWALHKLD
jgi:hypothetical protein